MMYDVRGVIVILVVGVAAWAEERWDARQVWCLFFCAASSIYSLLFDKRLIVLLMFTFILI